MKKGDRAAPSLAAIVADFASRVRAGAAPPIDEFVRLYPAHATELRKQLPAILRKEAASRKPGDSHASASPSEDTLGENRPRPEELHTLRGERLTPDGPTKFVDPIFASPQSSDELGRLGSYRILKLLGRGGMGAVYLAEDTRLQRRVALKVMLPDVAKHAEAYQRFMREARAAAALEHETIVTVYQVDEDRGVPFIAMALLSGITLEDRIQRGARLTPAEIVRIGREVATGLAVAHARGIVHRDVKPANIWIVRPMDDTAAAGSGDATVVEEPPPLPRVKILDFGLARPVAKDASVTRTGITVGTPAYMSVEQARGKPVDGRADLYSLGVVLYRLCTGELPYDGEDIVSIFAAMANESPRRPDERNPAIPPALSDLILHLLRMKPEDRPASARDVAAALGRIETDLLLGKATVTPEKPRPGRRRIAIAVAVGLALVGIGIAAAEIYSRRTPDSNPPNDADTKVVVNTPPPAQRPIAEPAVTPTPEPATPQKKTVPTPVKVPEKTPVEPTPVVVDRPRLPETIKVGPDKVEVAKVDPPKTPAKVTLPKIDPPTNDPLKVTEKVADPKPRPKMRLGPEFAELFNGRDLSGWRSAGTEWQVVDGDLVGRAGEEPAWLATKSSYKEFVLVVEWRFVNGGDASLSLHARDRDRETCEILLGPAKSDEGRLEAGSMLVYGREGEAPTVFPAAGSRLKAPGEWNILIAASSPQKIAIFLNDPPGAKPTPVMEADADKHADLAARLADSAPIGLLAIRGRVEIRRLALRRIGDDAPVVAP